MTTNSIRLILVTLASLLFLSGCGPDHSTFTPAPHSTGTVSDVYNDAAAWVKIDPENRYYAPVADTKSMEPVISSRSLVLCIRYKGQSLRNGSVVIFNRGDMSHVIHVIADQTETHVFMSGFNNDRSDGWFPKTVIVGFVVGQLYLPK